MMTLSDWLKETGTRQAELAMEVGCTQATISRLAAGLISPSVELAAIIKRVTCDAVGFESWVSHFPSQPAPAAFNNEPSHVPTSKAS